MFGLIRPCVKKKDKAEYKCYYCGLCTGMSRYTGFLSRVLLNYDFTIAYLVADSISADTKLEKVWCPLPIWNRIKIRNNPTLLQFMAERNYMLVYQKLVDDISDDGSWLAKIAERIMRKRYLALAGKLPEVAESIDRNMANLSFAEKRNEYIAIETASRPFGDMLGEVMAGCFDDPLDSQVFSQLCRYLGMWIYTIDACKDIKADAKKKKYNPILAGRTFSATEAILARKEEITRFLMHCKLSMFQLLELLSCEKNKDLVYSIFEHALPGDVAELLK